MSDLNPCLPLFIVSKHKMHTLEISLVFASEKFSLNDESLLLFDKDAVRVILYGKGNFKLQQLEQNIRPHARQ